MRNLLFKLLVKIIGENPIRVEGIDSKSMQNWLFASFRDDGYKQYYTLRKKSLQNEISLGIEEREYWKRIGRLEELRALSDNILRESKRRERLKKQHEPNK